jgi:hypothetical protein
MTVNLASILSPKFSWVVFGYPIDVDVGSTTGLVAALGAAAGAKLDLVKVKCLLADSVCIPLDILLVLPGPGAAVTPQDKCCCAADGIMKWDVLPEMKFPALYIGSASLAQLSSANRGKIGTKGASLTIDNVQINGSIFSAQIHAFWSENISGIDVTLLDGTYPVTFDTGVPNPFSYPLLEFDVAIFHVTINANISWTLNPNRICAELRAEWTSMFGSGNLQGPNGCS